MELDLQNLVWYKAGPLRGGSSGASVLGPESHERTHESLRCPMDLAIAVLFWFVHYVFGIFNSNPQLWEQFQLVLRPQSSIVPPCNISLEALLPVHQHNFFSQPIVKWKKNITLSEKFQTINRKIVEIDKFDIPITHIHDRSLSWLSTGTSVTSDGIKLVGL